MPLIDPDRVAAIFMECLYDPQKDTADMVKAEGIVCTVGFAQSRLDEHRDEITTMLKNLPLQFQEQGGGGWSFLNACNDKNGEQWTGLHQRMEQLFQLGLAINMVVEPMQALPRAVLPGGVPYYVVREKLVESGVSS